jgi:CubicO group peptidase (beta-lactamase class C family)
MSTNPVLSRVRKASWMTALRESMAFVAGIIPPIPFVAYRGRRMASVSIALATLSCYRQSLPAYQAPATLVANAIWPGATWDSIRDPRTVGWTRAGLDSARAVLSTKETTGFVAIVGGRKLMTYGNIDTVTYIASARKSVLSMLFGKYVRNGTVDLNESLADLGIDDLGGLTDQEKQATVKDLITARSGVFHPASNPGGDPAPPRGSQKHGTYFLYNNWDFNALGAAFEIMTKRDIYDALESDLARPIGMQDFDRAEQGKYGDTTQSRFLAYHMFFSTRDMARLGYLMLRQGNWNGRQLVPADWVVESTRVFTPVTELNPPEERSGPYGYGYLWWVWDGSQATGAFEGAYDARGAYGQYIIVMPKLDLVIAHKTRPDLLDAQGNPRGVWDSDLVQILNAIVRTHCGASCP